jgi:hypothetical protein
MDGEDASPALVLSQKSRVKHAAVRICTDVANTDFEINVWCQRFEMKLFANGGRQKQVRWNSPARRGEL